MISKVIYVDTAHTSNGTRPCWVVEVSDVPDPDVGVFLDWATNFGSSFDEILHDPGVYP